ncbi:hypothetical protein LAZ67_11003491, partial [Cordylochernes scorpioides]
MSSPKVEQNDDAMIVNIISFKEEIIDQIVEMEVNLPPSEECDGQAEKMDDTNEDQMTNKMIQLEQTPENQELSQMEETLPQEHLENQVNENDDKVISYNYSNDKDLSVKVFSPKQEVELKESPLPEEQTANQVIGNGDSMLTQDHSDANIEMSTEIFSPNKEVELEESLLPEEQTANQVIENGDSMLTEDQSDANNEMSTEIYNVNQEAELEESQLPDEQTSNQVIEIGDSPLPERQNIIQDTPELQSRVQNFIKKYGDMRQCKICRQWFPNSCIAFLHLYEVHWNFPKPAQRRTTRGRPSITRPIFKCSECNYESIHKQNRDRHFDHIHKKKKPFACEFCPLKTGTKQNLDRHVSTMHNHLINYYFILPKRLVTFITVTSGGDKLDHPFAAQAIRRSRRIQGLNPLEYSKMQHEGRETPQGEYHFKHIRNPSIFSGEPGQSSEKWLKEYHRVARFNCWDSSMCLANVYFFLSGTAKVWFENVEEQITSWELFETMLSQAFGHHASEKDQVLEKLKARAQGKGESSEAYIQDVLYLCRQINPNMNENEKVAHLVKGVSEEIYRAIVTFEIATTEEFIRWCRKIELSQKKRVNTRIVFDRLPNAAAINPAESESMEDLIRRIVREEIYHALNPEPATLKPSSLDLIIREEVERNLSAISQPVQRSMPRQQYSNRPQIFKQTPRQQFLNQRPPVPNQTSPQRRTDEWRTHENVPICFHCGRPGHVARYCRDRRRVFEEARVRRPTYSNNYNTWFNQNAEEVDHHIILGLDFFRATSAVIDCGRGEIHLKESVNDGLEEDLPTHALEDCFVPARSIKKITVINEDIRGGKDLMIEGSKDLILKKELVIPSSIINFHHGRGEIWVTNGTSQNQIIPAGMLVGYLRKIGSSGIYSVDTAEDDKTQSNIKNEDRRQQILSLVDDTTSNVKHKIDTSDSRPIKQRPYRVSPVERRAIQSEVDKMIKMGIVQPSESPWSSPVVLVKKKDGSWRFCVDYRKLNKVTKKDVYPLPRNDDVLDSLTGAKFFSSMDLRTGYWQIEIDEEDREKTAFITPDGLYEFRVMPFGLCNAPATFERMMDKLLAGLKWTICLCYLDDIIVYATSFKEHIERLGKVLRCIQQAGLCINHEKCRFGSREIKVLGHLVTESGIRPDPDKIEAITNFPTPKTTTEFRPYLFGKHFTVVSDHHSLCWLANVKDPSGRLARWALRLQEFDISIVYKNGKRHQDADCLSRSPLPQSSEDNIPELSSITDIRKEQRSDVQTKKIIQEIDSKSESGYKIIDGILYRKNYDPMGKPWLLVVPKQMRVDILREAHDAPMAGHLGFVKTYDRVRRKYFWPGLHRSVRQYVAHCRECQRRKGSTERPPGQLVPIPPVSRPFEKIGIDLLGRFPTSNDGNKWTVVATDYLTRYAMTKAIPNGSSEEVGKFIVEDVILKHGAPRELISDRGRTFISHTIRDINNLCGTAHRFTSAYHPQTNGLTERLNKTLGDMLSMYVDVDQRNWDSVLPYVTFAYNTAKQETTGFSPFYLVHGRDVETPLDTILTYREEANLEDYVESLVTNAEDARQLARLNILKAQEKDKSRYDKSHRPVQYRTEDLVWVYTPVRKQGLSEKLLKRYFGPYKVVRQLSE